MGLVPYRNRQFCQIADGNEAVGKTPEGRGLIFHQIQQIFLPHRAYLGGIVQPHVIVVIFILGTDVHGKGFLLVPILIGDLQGTPRLIQTILGHILTIVFHMLCPADIGNILLHNAKGIQIGQLGHPILAGNRALVVPCHGENIGIFRLIHHKLPHGRGFYVGEVLISCKILHPAGKVAVQSCGGQIYLLRLRGQLYIQLLCRGVFLSQKKVIGRPVCHGNADGLGGLLQAILCQIRNILQHTICLQSRQIICKKLHAASFQYIVVLCVHPAFFPLFQPDLPVCTGKGQAFYILTGKGQDQSVCLGFLRLLVFLFLPGISHESYHPENSHQENQQYASGYESLFIFL